MPVVDCCTDWEGQILDPVIGQQQEVNQSKEKQVNASKASRAAKQAEEQVREAE